MARTPAFDRIIYDRLAALVAGLVVVGLVIFLLVRNEAIASPQLFFALRVVLSFATAVVGATIPGFLDLNWKGSDLVVRAGGALALFVLTFVYTPNLVTDQGAGTKIIRSGDCSVAGNRNSGNTVNCTRLSKP